MKHPLRVVAPSTTASRALAALAATLSLTSAHAAAIDWTSAGTVWGTDANWTGGTAPANDLTTDIANFNSATYTNQPNVSAAARSVAGISLGAASGNVTITAGTTTTGLSIGGSGIDLSAATANLTLGAGTTQVFTVGANQTWTVASGRTLTVAGKTSIANNLVLSGGTVAFTAGGTNTTSTGTGAVTVNSGTTVSTTSTATMLGTGALTINGGTFSTPSNDLTFSNTSYAFNGNFTITLAGSGKKANFGSGAITLGGGTRQITVSTLIAATSGAIGDGGNGYGLTKAGSGILALSGTNTYTGTTTINAGTLYLGGVAGSGGIGAATATGTLSTNSAIVLGGTGILAFQRSNAVVQGTDFSGAAITGTGSLLNTGTGTLELNAANTFSGGTTAVNGGALTLKNALAIQNSTLTTGNASLVIFDSTAGTAWTVGGLGGAANYSLLTSNGSAMAMTISGSGAAGNANGTISGTGATITKNGANTQTFSGTAANTYTGLTTVSAGSLTANKTAGVDAIAGNVLINGTGTLTLSASNQINDAANVEIAAGTWALGNTTETVNGVKLTGGAITGTGTNNLTSTTAYDLQSGSASKILAGSVGVNKTTGGTVTLTGANTLTGGVTVDAGVLNLNAANAGIAGATQINGGTLSLGNIAALGNTTAINLASGARLTVAATDYNLSELAIANGGTGVVAGSFLRFNNSQSAAGAANGPGTIFGTVELAASVAPNWTNGLSAGFSLGDGSKITNVATATIGSSTSRVDLLGNATFEADTGTLTLSTNVSTSTAGVKTLTLSGAGNGTITGSSGNITNGGAGGTINVVKEGTGKWTVGAPTGHAAGSFTINEGTVQFSPTASVSFTTSNFSSLTLGDSTPSNTKNATLQIGNSVNPGISIPITVAAGSSGTLKIEAVSSNTGTLPIAGGITLANNLTLEGTSRLLTISTAPITGTGDLTTVGTVSLVGVMATQTGSITVNSGTLSLTDNNTLTGGVTVKNGAKLTAANTTAKSIAGAAGITMEAGSIFGGANSGTTSNTFNGTGGWFWEQQNAITHTISGQISGAGSLTVRGLGSTPAQSTYAMSSATGNNFSGGLFVENNTTTPSTGGRVQVNATAVNVLGSGVVTLSSNQTGMTSGTGSAKIALVANQTIAGLSSGTIGANNEVSVMGGSGSVNTLTLDGPNGINIFAGTIGSSLTNSSSGTGTAAQAPNLALVKTGGSTQILAGVNAYTGATTVNGGTLSIASTGSINSTSGVFIGAGEFNYNSSTALTPSVTFSGTGGTLSGDGSFGSALTVTSGNTLAPGNSPGLQTFTNGLTLNGGSIFSFELADDTVTGRGTNFDAVNVTGGTFTVAAGTVTFNITLNSAGSTTDFTDSFWDTNQSWLVFQTSGVSVVGSIVVGAITNDTVGVNFGAVGGSFNVRQDTNDFYLDYTATSVPEPSSYAALAGLAVLGLVATRRRRRA